MASVDWIRFKVLQPAVQVVCDGFGDCLVVPCIRESNTWRLLALDGEKIGSQLEVRVSFNDQYRARLATFSRSALSGSVQPEHV